MERDYILEAEVTSNPQEEKESDREFGGFWQGLLWVLVIVFVCAGVWLGATYRHEISACVQAAFGFIRK